jgi:hypothetical protein
MATTIRPILVAMLCAAAVTGQFVAGKATRDALFLTSLGFHALPMMLVAASVSSLLLAAVHARWATRIAPAALTPLLFAASGLLFICEWFVRLTMPAATAVLLFLHTSAISPLLTSGFWLIASERFDPRTAKRRFGQITGAGTLGGLFGALISERVAATLGAPAMLLVLAGFQFLMMWLFSRFAFAYTSGEREYHEPLRRPTTKRSSLRVIAEAPHLRHLVLLVLLGSTSAALLDYVFKAKAVEAVGAGDPLMRFFALYYAAISLVTFALQAMSSGIALQRFGLALTISTPSVALLAGSFGSLISPAFGSLATARAGEAIFRASWFRAGYELFYTPIPADQKRAAKSVVDVGADRLGDAVGGGLVRMAVLLAPWSPSSVILWMAFATSAAAIVVASRLNRWYVRTLGTSLVIQAPDLAGADAQGEQTRSLLLNIRRTNRVAGHRRPDEAADALALQSGDHEQAIEVLSREEGLNRKLVPYAIPLLGGPLTEYAVFALRKVAEEHVGQLTDALLDPNHDIVIRRQLARVFSICVSQRAVDGLLLALEDERYDVRYQAARSLAAIAARNPRVRIDRDLVLEVVLREVKVSRPVWESRRLLGTAINESPLDQFVRDRAGQSLAHVFTLLSLVLPSQPLQIAFRSLHSENTRLRGTAFEYLEGVLPADIRQHLWPFLAQGGAKRPSPPQHDQILANLLRSSTSVTLHGVAASR